MAYDILAMLIFIMAFESTFSIGCHVLDNFKSSLAHKLVEAFVRANKAYEKPLIVEGCLDELENFEQCDF